MTISCKQIVENAQSAFFVVNESGDIVEATRGLYAIPAQVFVERGIDAFDLIVAESERIPFAEMLVSVLEGNVEINERVFQATTCTANGYPAFFALTMRKLPQHPHLFLFEVFDRTQLVGEEREISRQQRETQIFKDISYLRQIHQDSDRFFNEALAAVTEAVEADAALLYVRIESHDELLVHNNIVADGKVVPATYVRLPRGAESFIHTTLSRSDDQYVDRVMKSYVTHGWLSHLVVPLMVRDERVGMLVLLSKGNDAFPWHAVRLATSTASYLGAFMATELLWRQKERLHALAKSAFAYSQDGLFVVDRDGVIIERNALAEQVQGEGDGKTLVGSVLPGYKKRASAFIRGLSSAESPRTTVVFAADPTHSFEITATPLATGELVQYLCIARNVTGWIDERSALQERNDQLAMVDRMKDEFVSMVSHELRSPLTVVMGNLSLIERTTPPEQREPIAAMRRNIERLNRLVRDILEVTRLEYAEISFNTSLVELTAIEEVVVAAVSDQLRDRHLVWSSHVASATVTNDPLRLTQIVSNIVNNAVQHTPDKGKIVLDMSVTDDVLTIVVSDSGEGMTRVQQRHMFERFYRGEHTHAGFGLGLYIVKKLLDRMRGTVLVKSAVGVGTTITITIPRVI